MPTPPYAKVLFSVSAGAPTSGGVIVVPGDIIQLSAESTVGWVQKIPPEYRLYSYSEGFTLPAGWLSKSVLQTDGTSATVYYYLGASPPSFTIPASGWWGKILFGLYVDGGGGALTDETSAVKVFSPNGLSAIIYREGSQFGDWRKWTAELEATLHVLDTLFTGIAQIVPTAVDLTALDDTALADGAAVWVAQFRDVFNLNTGSTATVDGVLYVATDSGTGRWHRRGLPSLHWLAQAEWHIDSAAGDDGNTGATSGTKIKTPAEMDRRLGNLEVDTTVAITLYDDVGRFVPPAIGPNGRVVVTTVATTLYTGAFTAVVPSDDATNVAQNLTDSALSADWDTAGPSASSLLCLRVRITSGARVGAVGWAQNVNGAKGADTTEFLVLSTTAPLPYQFTVVAPQIADPFVVESVPEIGELVFEHPISPSVLDGNGSRLVFSGVKFAAGVQHFVPNFGSATAVAFVGCDLNSTRGNFIAHGCMGDNIAWYTGDYPFWYGGGIVATLYGVLTIYGGALVEFSQGARIMGASVDLQGHMYWTGTLGVAIAENTLTSGLIIRSGAVARASGNNSPLWGGGNKIGVLLQAGSTLAYESTKPSIDGTTTPLEVAGDSLTWADVPVWIKGAQVVDLT